MSETVTRTSVESLVYELVEQQRNRDDVPQSAYVIEECSELIKELIKLQRGKGNQGKVVDEACDVLLTVLVLLREYNITQEDVLENMSYKLTRALDRYQESGEI